MKWRAPAKINLSLRVLGRREDGFHEIETLIVPLTLSDELEIELTATPGITLTCSDATLPTGPENLAHRAATLFLQHFGLAGKGVQIALEKHIPHGAGLGGGSSDAATVLLALNELSGIHADSADLARVAAELGSDVPVFIYQGAAVCRGRGERVEPVTLASGDPLPLLLLKPPFPIPTPWAYSRWRDSRELPDILYTPQTFSWGTLVNDLERPVFQKYLPLAAMKMWLLAQPGVTGALLSGSGSTVLAVLQDSSAGPDLARRAQEEFGDWWCWLGATAA